MGKVRNNTEYFSNNTESEERERRRTLRRREPPVHLPSACLEFAISHWAVAGGLESKPPRGAESCTHCCRSSQCVGGGWILSTMGQPGAAGCRAVA